MKTKPQAATLSPAAQAAHERIMALQTVYDAAVAVLKADQVVCAVPDFGPAQEVFDEALSHLNAVVWNTQFILKEPYEFADEEIAEANVQARLRARSPGVQKSLGLTAVVD